MEFLLVIAGWIGWAIVVALTYILVPFIIWRSTQERNLPVALEPIVYWIFLIPGSFLFSLSDIDKFHIIWVSLLFGAVGWWINDTSYKWEYDDKK